ncbi:MAG: PIN domain-containing protein [Gammaproteobacteria bacterium]|nr:PIN domain-containing protein [Gammaproteobacteria bacterium]
MSRICLDTSAYSNFRRGESRVVAHLDRADWIGVPSVVVGELWTGFQLGARTDENASEIDEFLSHAVVETLPVDTVVAHIYGEIFADLRRKGRPLPTNDIWIAATAARAGATILTFDEHFREISRVGSIILEKDR